MSTISHLPIAVEGNLAKGMNAKDWAKEREKETAIVIYAEVSEQLR